MRNTFFALIVTVVPLVAFASQRTTYTPPAADATARAAATAAQGTANTALAFATNVFSAQLTPAVEVDPGSTRSIGIQVNDRNGDPIAFSVQMRCVLYDANQVPALAAAFTLAETGLGAELSTSGQPALLVETNITGAATVTVTDVALGSGLTVDLQCTVLGSFGTTSRVPLTFDGDNA